MLKEKYDKSIIAKMAKGEYPTTIIHTSYGDFEVKYPNGKENGIIERRKAIQLSGMPRSTFPPDFLNGIHRDCTLSIVITSYPEGFNEDWKEEHMDNFPDEEVKNSLYKEFDIFFIKTQKEISGKSK